MPAKKPWRLTFSFGRALQQTCLNVWKGDDKNEEAAQQVQVCGCLSGLEGGSWWLHLCIIVFRCSLRGFCDDLVLLCYLIHITTRVYGSLGPLNVLIYSQPSSKESALFEEWVKMMGIRRTRCLFTPCTPVLNQFTPFSPRSLQAFLERCRVNGEAELGVYKGGSAGSTTSLFQSNYAY